MALSLIIPTLNEAASLGATLEAIARLAEPVEVIIVDGGSRDDTVELARARGFSVLTAECGRGAQMHTGASVARGEVLWFLHADTQPPIDAAQAIAAALQDETVVGGNFEIQFDGRRRAARFLSWLYPHLRRLGLFYGDSAIFVRRAIYEQAGGFQALPIFEDLDLIRRLRRRGRLVRVPLAVLTSSRRFEGRSFTLTFLRWALLQSLYWLGVSPHRLSRHYAPIRALQSEPE